MVEEGHLRWDSLGEFCALVRSLKFIDDSFGNKKAGMLGKAVDKATQMGLENNKSPARHVGQTDTRDSHFSSLSIGRKLLPYKLKIRNCQTALPSWLQPFVRMKIKLLLNSPSPKVNHAILAVTIMLPVIRWKISCGPAQH